MYAISVFLLSNLPKFVPIAILEHLQILFVALNVGILSTKIVSLSTKMLLLGLILVWALNFLSVWIVGFLSM